MVVSVTPRVLHAFIDEAGVRARTAASSDHFVMSAVMIPDNGLTISTNFLAQLRQQARRGPGQLLHWRNFTPADKTAVATAIGKQQWLVLSSVVVCKRALTGSPLNDDQAYLYTFRFLLERLSWYARDHQAQLKYTLAHIIRFKLAKLRQYEANLKLTPGCQIAWDFLDPAGGSIDQPARVEQLQLADAVASATFAAFEPRNGVTDQSYLKAMAPRLYRRGSGLKALTSYGLKIHPWSDTTKAAYPWVAAL
ncbi:DUF3800 domain-containing protein [Actinoplanes sp. NPDC026670]|uniref:DUF3800 domain-containing protein n=1 Tax=Actinoplanes sp. NPDC026670 TaxID=3154700 RepID=UPI0033C6D78D